MLKLLTYSAMSTFMSCRKQYEYRYLRGITPDEASPALSFGTAMHRGLESLFTSLKDGEPQAQAIDDAVTACTLEAGAQGLEIDDILKCEVMMRKYGELYYADDARDWAVENIEMEFRLPFLSPLGTPSEFFECAGKVDGIIRDRYGRLFILEHKTASRIDDGYVARIQIDTQIMLYASAVERVLGEPVIGAVYDILVKPRIIWNDGETDEEFEARKAAAKCPSRCKRKEADTQDTFRTRLNEAVTDDNFRREIIEFNADRMDEFMREIWTVSQDMGECSCYYKNTGSCTRYGVCPYMALCQHNGNLDGLDGFTIRRPHEELSEEITEQEEI